MSRSVSYLTGAEQVVYDHLDRLFDHEVDNTDFDFLIEDYSERLQDDFPSLEPCEWYDGEVRIFLQNMFCEIGIAEYNGLISLSIRPTEHDRLDHNIDGLARHWVEQARTKFEAYGRLIKRGTFSNGEAVFTTKDLPEHNYSSKEGLMEWLEPEGV